MNTKALPRISSSVSVRAESPLERESAVAPELRRSAPVMEDMVLAYIVICWDG